MSFFHVNPRYTCGSPGMVSEDQASRVVQEERRAYEHSLSGIYGDIDQARAQDLGLDGIAEEWVERKGGWDIVDMITGKEKRREVRSVKKLRRGDTVVRCSAMPNADLPIMVTEVHIGRYDVILRCGENTTLCVTVNEMATIDIPVSREV